MRKLLLALALALALPSVAFAQCNGVFPSGTVCGNPVGSPNIPGPLPLTTFALAPGGVSGNVQTNNGSGGLAGINNTQLTADVNNVTSSLPGLIPAFPNTTNTFFRGDGTYATLPSPPSPITSQAAKTSNYTVASTDCNTLIPLGTGTTAQFILTLPILPSAGFGAGCTIWIKNDDVYSGIGTGHAMTLAGFPADAHSKLYPQQAIMVTINSAGTGWKTAVNPGRWILPTTAEICYAQNGNNANDGLGAGTGCMASVQQALVEIGNFWDGGGYNSCAIGLYTGGTNKVTESVNQTGQSVGCYLTINFRGAVTWNTAGACYIGGDNSITIFDWSFGFTPTFSCNTANAASTGQLKCHQYCVFDLSLAGGTAIWLPGGNPGVNTGSNDVFFYCDLQCSATYNAQVNIGDGTNTFAPLTFIQCQAHCSKVTASGTVAFSAHVTMGVAFSLNSGSVITTTLSWPGATVTNPSTPTGYSILITNGTTIPGGTSPNTGFPAQNSTFGLVCSSPC